MGKLYAVVNGSDFSSSARPETLRMDPRLLAGNAEAFMREQMDPFIELGLGIAWMWPLGYWNHEGDLAGGFKTTIGVDPVTGRPVLSGVHSANVVMTRLPSSARRILSAIEKALAPRVQRVHDQGAEFIVYLGGDDVSTNTTDRYVLKGVMPFLSAGVDRWGLDTAPLLDRSRPSPTRTLADVLTYMGHTVDVEPALPVNKGYEAWRRVTWEGGPRYGVWSTYLRARVAEAGAIEGAEAGWWQKATDQVRRYGVSFGSELLEPRPEWPAELSHAGRRAAEAEYWLERGYDVYAGLHNIDPDRIRAIVQAASAADVEPAAARIGTDRMGTEPGDDPSPPKVLGL